MGPSRDYPKLISVFQMKDRDRDGYISKEQFMELSEEMEFKYDPVMEFEGLASEHGVTFNDVRYLYDAIFDENQTALFEILWKAVDSDADNVITAEGLNRILTAMEREEDTDFREGTITYTEAVSRYITKGSKTCLIL